MRKHFYTVIFIIVICLTISGCAAQTALQAGELRTDGPQAGEEVKYTLYIGLNDKDTYTQLLSTEEAEKIVTDIALKYVDGFTKLSGKGAYKDEQGVVTYENSLIFEFYFCSEEQITAIMDEVLPALNQNSILVEKQRVECEFYEGATP